MKLPPEMAEEGLRAYEQAGAFERLRRRRLLLVYVLCPVALLVFGAVAAEVGKTALALGCLTVAIALAVFNTWNWRRLRAQYTRNLALLAQLKQEYGDDLPWLEVERHLAALDKLALDLAREDDGEIGAGESARPE